MAERGCGLLFVAFTVRLPEALHERLRKVAFKKRLSMSKLLRFALLDFLGTKEKEEN